MRREIFLLALLGLAGPGARAQEAATRPHVYKGLEMTVTGVVRASTAGLRDCPPGDNTVRGTTRPGEQFALVSVAFKVSPSFKPVPLHSPALKDTGGASYRTAASFVDVGTVPEFSCTFPFRVPEGAKLKTLVIETESLDLASFEKPKP